MGEGNSKLSGYHFRSWREWAGLTQTQLAKAMGRSVSTVSRIEKGEREFTTAFLEDFHHFCGTPSVGTVLDRCPDKRPFAEGEDRDFKASRAEVEKMFASNIGRRAKAVKKSVRKAHEEQRKGERPGPKKNGDVKPS